MLQTANNLYRSAGEFYLRNHTAIDTGIVLTTLASMILAGVSSHHLEVNAANPIHTTTADVVRIMHSANAQNLGGGNLYETYNQVAGSVDHLKVGVLSAIGSGIAALGALTGGLLHRTSDEIPEDANGLPLVFTAAQA